MLILDLDKNLFQVVLQWYSIREKYTPEFDQRLQEWKIMTHSSHWVECLFQAMGPRMTCSVRLSWTSGWVPVLESDAEPGGAASTPPQILGLES